MANDRTYETEELLVRPGTYFNPQTEVLIVVDDSSSMDNEIFNLEEFEGADWVLVSDESPVDEAKRDELLENFQATYHGGDGRQTRIMDDPDADDDAPVGGENEPPLADVGLRNSSAGGSRPPRPRGRGSQVG